MGLKDRFVEGSFHWVNIDDLVVRVYEREGFSVRKIVDTVIYFCLKNFDKTRYDEYHALVRRKYNVGDCHTWEKFMDLYDKFKLTPNLVSVEPLVEVMFRNDRLEIVDGQHRASIMRLLGWKKVLVRVV